MRGESETRAKLDQWMRAPVKNSFEEMLSGVSITFSDNMNLPVHRWYRFPAGFSADLVKSMIRILNVNIEGLAFDPFTGCGTSNVACKSIGMNSVGIEAHPLLSWIAKVKVYWEFNLADLKAYLKSKLTEIRECLKQVNLDDYDLKNKPKFLLKCFDEETLVKLYTLKELVEEESDGHLREFLLLGVLGILRKVTPVASGWSYILPKHKKKKNVPQVEDAYSDQIWMMYQDTRTVTMNNKKVATALIHEKSDARNLGGILDDNEIDFEFTSPPYLNNYDYADRTRPDLYFLGWATTWREITKKVRKKLIISATTQINRTEMGNMSPRAELPPDIRKELIEAQQDLSRSRLKHGGKKDYDLMVVGYFNDMYTAMSEMYRVLKPDRYAVMILGDSAPYGVHIPTDIYLARVGKHLGFEESKIYVLRKRGGKWTSIRGDRRHNVPLRESLIIFKK